MKEPWCLAVSDAEASPAEVVKHYARRWGIESYFRDTKDLHFGMGMDAIRTKSTARRDRLFLLRRLRRSSESPCGAGMHRHFERVSA